MVQEWVKRYKITRDVAASEVSAKCDDYWTEDDDCLKLEWSGRNWMNPPYNKPEKACAKNCKKKKCPKRGFHLKNGLPGQFNFVKKAHDEALVHNRATTVCLLPSRTDTDIFQRFIWDSNNECAKYRVRFIPLKGRLRFKGAKDPAPFPSMIVIFHTKDDWQLFLDKELK